MIDSAWPFLALMLLCAGVFPTIERTWGGRVFHVLPPIVMTYLLVTTLAVAGLWSRGPDIATTQQLVVRHGLPALLFLMLSQCDLGAVFALGRRVLIAFVSASLAVCAGVLITYLLLRDLLPRDGWMPLAALNGSWIGGTANLIAVKQAIGMPDTLLSPALLTDTICYSTWVVALFSATPLAARFNRWTGGALPAHIEARVEKTAEASPGPLLLWLGIALSAGLGCRALGETLPASQFLSATTWTLLLASVAGLVAARLPLRRLPGAPALASALLAVLVACMASQSDFTGLLSAPVFVLAGFCVLAIHAVLLALAAKLFKLDLYLCGVASLANIGGVASAPLLAAAYSPVLVPVGVLLALFGYFIGTGAGIAMAALLSGLAPAGG